MNQSSFGAGARSSLQSTMDTYMIEHLQVRSVTDGHVSPMTLGSQKKGSY